MISKIKNYLTRAEKYPTWRFILEMTILCFILKITFALFFGIIFSALNWNTQVDLSFENELARAHIGDIIITIIVFAAFETFTGQWLMLRIASFFTKRNLYKILFSALIFALLHVDFFSIFIVFPIGLVLAWSFLTKRKIGKWEAVWVTTAIHVLHNLVALGLVALGS